MNSTGVSAPARKVKRGLSVGLKMIIGVGLFSNLCICILLYVNFTSFFQIASRTNELLEMNSSMNRNLRTGIFDLQKKFLEIPKFLETDAAQDVLSWIRQTFPIEKEETLTGADQYRSFFDRAQRRDISTGKFILVPEKGSVIVSKGLLNSDGRFADTVFRIFIKSEHPDQDIDRIHGRLKTVGSSVDSPDLIKQKIMDLKSLLADDALAAETARNEILYKTEDIQKQEAALLSYRQEKRDTIGVIAVLAIVINLALLYLMAFFVVEQPLRHLTRVIEKINRDHHVPIPFQHRKDQIGVLAGALKNFQSVQMDLKKKDEQKKMEKVMIQELIQKISGLIDGLQKKAMAMKKTAVELSNLAADTKEQTHEVTRSTTRTAEQTHIVSDSTLQLQSGMADIGTLVLTQQTLISDISHVAHASRENIRELTQASEQINDIVHIVKNLAGETRLLSLNARIEAARSGPAGKGFAVVAGEIKDFSHQTEDAGEDITLKIEAIQKVSQAVIENTRQIEIQVEKLMAASFHIKAAVEKQSCVTRGIAQNAHEAGRDITDVSERILHVTEAARSTSRFADNVQSLSQEVEEELTTLLTNTREKLSAIGLTGFSGEI